MTDTSPGPETAPEGPLVVMLVGNNVTNDNRVLKTATTLTRAGLRVTVIGYATSGTRSDVELDDVRILRVPVDMRLKAGRNKSRGRRRQRRLVLAGWSTSSAAAAAQLAPVARLRESGGGSLSQTRAKAATFVVRVRAGVQRRIDGVIRLGWRVWDKAWSLTGFGVRWRKVAPELRDFELAFGPVIDSLQPDVIHAHDYHMVNVASLAAARAEAAGRTVPWVYDAHEFVPGMATYGGKTPRIIAAYAKAEAEYIRDADAVITVSPFIAEELERRHRLPARPSLVLNAPALNAELRTERDVRSAVGLGPDTALLVYSGGVTPARGIDTVVRALPLLPEVHLAVIAVPSTKGKVVERLVDVAKQLGVRDRLHLLEPVGPDEVTAFLRTADVGVHPLPGGIPNHDMALPNKLFEYLQAGLPLVVSDAKALADFVTSHHVGASFTTGDAASLAGAVTRVLADRATFAGEVVAQRDQQAYTWQGQEETLVGVYRGLLGLPLTISTEPFEIGKPRPRHRTSEGVVLGIGPANSAGQGWAWGRAAERFVPDVTAEVLAVEKPAYNYPADVLVAVPDFARGREWQLAFGAHVSATWTHALLEAGRPVVGTLHGRDFVGDVEALRAAGIAVGLVFHGSEVRDPRRHAETHRFSPFTDPHEELTEKLQRKCDELLPLVAAFTGPKFVSTPDQLDYVDGAVWLPVVVDTTELVPSAPLLERDVPVVVHAPSNGILKGTAQVEAVLVPMAEQGLIDYRRIEGVPPEQVGAMLADADIVVDQLVLGLYGVLSCEGLALGRVVVGHVGDSLRSRVPAVVPIVEATPADLGDVMARLLADRDAARAVAAAGPEFVATFHDGRMSAQILQENLLSTSW
jgi:glycosyltransferase involved in cell wall biosynthesis